MRLVHIKCRDYITLIPCEVYLLIHLLIYLLLIEQKSCKNINSYLSAAYLASKSIKSGFWLPVMICYNWQAEVNLRKHSQV